MIGDPKSRAFGARLSLGISPCPNDTFVFFALLSGKIRIAPEVTCEPIFCDIDVLNAKARAEELDIAKVSYAIVPELLSRYVLLRAGGAVGRGCGPLLVAKEPDLRLGDLHGQPVAVPGLGTTASLLLRLRDGALGPFVCLPFHEIPRAVAEGRVAAGLIIHESRFTYRSFGLSALCDLGQWWEQETGLPIPLGAIVVRASLGAGRISEIERAVRESAKWALAHPAQTRSFVREHAQELDDAVIDAHIALYVSSFAIDLGEEGGAAVKELFRRAGEVGARPALSNPHPHRLPERERE